MMLTILLAVVSLHASPAAANAALTLDDLITPHLANRVAACLVTAPGPVDTATLEEIGPLRIVHNAQQRDVTVSWLARPRDVVIGKVVDLAASPSAPDARPAVDFLARLGSVSYAHLPQLTAERAQRLRRNDNANTIVEQRDPQFAIALARATR